MQFSERKRCEAISIVVLQILKNILFEILFDSAFALHSYLANKVKILACEGH